MNEATIESGMARVAAGEWLVGTAQPAAFFGRVDLAALRGFVVPDRAAVRRAVSTGDMWCSSADAPFLMRLDALPDDPLRLVSAKLLVAPFASRIGARAVKLIPMSFSRAMPVTEFRAGWAVAATRSRVTKVVVEDGATLVVGREALVAWTGPLPTGFCPKLSVWDILLPRGPRNLAFSFHGPSVVWFEGARPPSVPRRPTT